MEIEWSHESLDDMAALDKRTARRVKQTVERFHAEANIPTPPIPGAHQ
ncbi:MAG: hypothetical protein ABI693_15615 [Bryobacteraceae bacterium]